MSVLKQISQKTIATLAGAVLLPGCAQLNQLKDQVTGSKAGTAATAAAAPSIASAASGATAWVASAAASAASAARDMVKKGDKKDLSPAAQACAKNNVTIKVLESGDASAKPEGYSTEINGPKGERVQVSFKTRTDQGPLKNLKESIVKKTVTPAGLAACMRAVTGDVTPKSCAASLVVFSSLAAGGADVPQGYKHAADIKGKDGRLMSVYTLANAKPDSAKACIKDLGAGVPKVQALGL